MPWFFVLCPIDGFSPFSFLEMGMWYADCGHLFACNLSLTILRLVPFSLLPNFSKLNSHQMGKRCGGKSLMSPHGNWRVSVNAIFFECSSAPETGSALNFVLLKYSLKHSPSFLDLVLRKIYILSQAKVYSCRSDAFGK